MNPIAAADPAARFVGPGSWRQGSAYGLLGLPLAFVALPLYVLLPNHYAREFAAPLGALGAVLLATRLVDALLDPAIGRWCDRLAARSARAVLGVGALAAVALALGLWALLFPPASLRSPTEALLAWAAGALVLTYIAYSVLSVAHQAWGARLGGDEAQRSRVVAWREGFALVGVLVASVLPALAGLAGVVIVFAAALALAWWAWSVSVAPRSGHNLTTAAPSVSPWRHGAFRRLMAVFVLNGTASALPATLVLFFVQDRLQAPAHAEPVVLATYFACGALSIPLWVRAVARWGLARSWLLGMALAVATFAWAATLDSGDWAWFVAVCALSGLALGADLALPGAMLAGVIGQLGERGRSEGAFFGWWNLAAKLNLALAAGVALPLLALWGYAPGARDPQALQALTAAYCLLPCLLKCAAALALYLGVIRPATGRAPSPSHT